MALVVRDRSIHDAMFEPAPNSFCADVIGHVQGGADDQDGNIHRIPWEYPCNFHRIPCNFHRFHDENDTDGSSQFDNPLAQQGGVVVDVQSSTGLVYC